MDQHPIPRNVTGFEFQLIGFMTLKQFFYLLFAAGIGLFFWKAPLGIISIPLAFLSGLIGVAFAFLPVQERPLEVWIKNFLISIYSPTQFVWQQEKRSLEILKPTKRIAVNAKNIKFDEALHQDAKSKLAAYLNTLENKNNVQVDKQEEAILKQVSNYIGDPSTQSIAQKQVTPDLEKGIIRGTVRIGDKPLSSILIQVFDVNKEPVRMITTDARGRFTTKLSLPEGVYSLVTEDPAKKYEFKHYSFRVTNEPLKPWLITPITNVN